MAFACCVIAVSFFAVVFADSALAQDNCAKKEQLIEQEIAIAKSYGNSSKAAGLEEALTHMRLYCSDESLLGKAEMKVLEKRERIREREADLHEAKQQDDVKKISKREKKLEEARKELLEAERARDALKK